MELVKIFKTIQQEQNLVLINKVKWLINKIINIKMINICKILYKMKKYLIMIKKELIIIMKIIIKLQRKKST